jgi:hypothetical protein
MSALPAPEFATTRAALAVAGALLGLGAARLAVLQLRAAPAAAPRHERNALHCARICFLLLSLALAAGAVGGWLAAGDPWPRDAQGAWILGSWLVWFIVLHVHRVKPYKGRIAAFATVAAWTLSLLAAWALGLRPWA